jgi:hypothetical protein
MTTTICPAPPHRRHCDATATINCSYTQDPKTGAPRSRAQVAPTSTISDRSPITASNPRTPATRLMKKEEEMRKMKESPEKKK